MNISNGNARGVEVSQGIVKCVSAGMLRRQIKIKAKSQRCRCSDKPFNLSSFSTGFKVAQKSQKPSNVGKFCRVILKMFRAYAFHQEEEIKHPLAPSSSIFGGA